MRSAFHLVVLMLLLSGAGAAQIRLTSQERAQVQHLKKVATTSRGYNYMPPDLTHDRAYARAWLFLADTASQEKVRVIAFRAVTALYSPNPKAPATFNGQRFERTLVGKEYRRVVLHGLGARNDKVLRAAVGATGNSLWGIKPHKPTLSALLSMIKSHSNADVRRAALFQLGSYRFADPKVGPAFLAGIEDKESAKNRRKALYAYRFRLKEKKLPCGPAVDKKVLAAATRRLKDKDPFVRGEAIVVCGFLARRLKDKKTLANIRRMVKDAHPYVRCSAALAFAELGDRAALKDLVRLLDDPTPNECSKIGHTNLTPSRIDDAALRGIHLLSEGRFNYSLYKAPWKARSAKEIASEVARAKAWAPIR